MMPLQKLLGEALARLQPRRRLCRPKHRPSAPREFVDHTQRERKFRPYHGEIRLQARRQAASYLLVPAVTQKLFSEIAPKFGDRAGGYTRIIHAGNRVGDNAKVAILEFVGYQYKEKEKKEKPKKEEATETK